MNVEEFVKTTLEEIARGASSVENEETHQCVNPEIPVHFDIAVTATDTSGVKAGGQLKVAPFFEFGGGAKGTKEAQNYNRVSFDLVFHIPTKSF